MHCVIIGWMYTKHNENELKYLVRNGDQSQSWVKINFNSMFMYYVKIQWRLWCCWKNNFGISKESIHTCV